MTQTRRFLLGLGLVGLLPAFGQFTPISAPTDSYIAGTQLAPITAANLSVVTSVTNGSQTVTFSTPLQARTVPSSWATWGSPPNTESSTPRVVAEITGSIGALTLTLSAPATTVGFEVEPNANTHSITADFRNGATSLGTITRSTSGSSGALLFAATTTTPITSVVLTIPTAAAGFALAQVRTNVGVVTGVPTLGPAALIILTLLILAYGARQASKQARCQT